MREFLKKVSLNDEYISEENEAVTFYFEIPFEWIPEEMRRQEEYPAVDVSELNYAELSIEMPLAHQEAAYASAMAGTGVRTQEGDSVIYDWYDVQMYSAHLEAFLSLVPVDFFAKDGLELEKIKLQRGRSENISSGEKTAEYSFEIPKREWMLWKYPDLDSVVLNLSFPLEEDGSPTAARADAGFFYRCEDGGYEAYDWIAYPLTEAEVEGLMKIADRG